MECKKCTNPYIGKTQTKVCMELNNSKSAPKFFKTKKSETQKLFQEHYVQDDQAGKNDWHLQ